MKASRPLPRYFYKYTSLEGKREAWAYQIADRRALYFSPPNAFNDPFDSKVPVDMLSLLEMMRVCESTAHSIRESIRVSAESLDHSVGLPILASSGWESQRASVCQSRDEVRELEDHLTQLETDIIAMRARVTDLSEKFQSIQSDLNTIGILCLSERPDSMLMWSHYADGHKGICFEFDGTHEFFSGAIDVRYQAAPPGLDLEEIIFTKSLAWEYEREWRLLNPASAGGSGLRPFPAECLIGVICGYKMAADIRDRIEELANRSHLVMKSAVLDIANYALKVENVAQ